MEMENASFIAEYSLSNVTDVMNDSRCPEPGGIIYMALECYPVTVAILVSNIVLCILATVIIFMNVLSATAVYLRDEVDNPSDLLIASLAISDTVVGMFLVYQSAYNLGNWQVFLECLFRYGILASANISSMFHLCLLTIDRYVKITRPYLYPRVFTNKFVIGISFATWLLSLFLGFLPMLGWNKGTPLSRRAQCGFYFVMDRGYILFLDILFYAPVIVNIFLYGHMFKVAQRHAKVIAAQQSTTSDIGPSKGTLQFAKTVFILMGLYVACWTPTGIFMFLEYHDHLEYMSLADKGMVMMYLSVLAYINSLVNPIVYAIKIPYIKKKFGQVSDKMLCRK
ncbi:adenosine receptor A2b-like [Liolophura sinensis]|uniref:adenosine receptor A2b-like n=1 Tax=Liolophura sinensis TaxID=3198878 RepID=UPI0031591573